MPDLRSYMSQLRRARDLAVIRRAVPRRYAVAAQTARHDGREALLFESVRASGMRIASNLVGTRRRFAAALGAREDSIHSAIYAAARSPRAPRASASPRFAQNSSRSLAGLPVVTHYEKEPGPFITSSIIHARNPETRRQNLSFHRMMPLGARRLSVRMVEGRHLHRCFEDARDHGEDLRVAVSIGVHPAILIAGAYQAEWGRDELAIANSLLRGRLRLATCAYSQMRVPAGAEIVLDGRILQDATAEEWMVEMLRTYDHKRRQPVFELDRMYFRDNAIFHDILSGYSEHRLLMGMPVEAKLDGTLRRLHPRTVRGVSLTEGGCNWMHAVVSVRKTPSARPKRIIRDAFSAHRSLKRVVLVDEDIDARSAESVEYAIATRFQADRDMVIVRGARGSSLDPSSDQRTLRTAKLGIDATRPLSKRREGFEIARIPGA